MSLTILSIKDLNISFNTPNQIIKAVSALSIKVEKGEVVALVGESGSGKSITALSILGLLNYPIAFHSKGSIKFINKEILGKNNPNLQNIRGNRISMIFQEPMTSLNPLHTVRKQVSESFLIHQKIERKAIDKKVLSLLKSVKLDSPEEKLNFFPYQLSGGQRQRVMIAMAIANKPDLLIADEPTTALDVTIQSKILNLILDLQKNLNMSVLLITHDLNIVKNIAKRIYIMHRGKIVEEGTVKKVFSNPKKEYTYNLLNTHFQKFTQKVRKYEGNPLLEVKNLKVYFPVKKGILKKTIRYVKAVNDVSFHVNPGETLGIVGESGSGKTTLGQSILKLIPSKGIINFDGIDINSKSQKYIRPYRKNMQFVFQDPFASLSPRMSLFSIISEGLEIHNIGEDVKTRRELVSETLRKVGLSANDLDRYPHEFSGGQRQRIAIARAIIIEPKLVVLDEPTSALDRNIQLQIINLLQMIQKEKNLSYVFISHDLRVIKSISNRLIVMNNGKIVEYGNANNIFNKPKNYYTKSLLKSAYL